MAQEFPQTSGTHPTVIESSNTGTLPTPISSIHWVVFVVSAALLSLQFGFLVQAIVSTPLISTAAGILLPVLALYGWGKLWGRLNSGKYARARRIVIVLLFILTITGLLLYGFGQSWIELGHAGLASRRNTVLIIAAVLPGLLWLLWVLP